MTLSPVTLVTIVDGEELTLFENTGHQRCVLPPKRRPTMADRASGAAGRIAGSRGR